MKDAILKFWNDEDGATAIEYGLIAGLIAVVIIAAVSTLGDNIKNIFCEISAQLVSNKVAGAAKCDA